MKLITKEISTKERNQTILVISLGFLVLYGFSRNPFFLMVTIFVGTAGLTSKWLSLKIVYLWNKLAWLLSLFMPKIILSVIFLLVLTPIALVSRLFKPDTLLIKNTSNSTFKSVKASFSKKDFQNPW
jgi:hypothetical protein